MKMEGSPYDIGGQKMEGSPYDILSDAHSGDARADEHCSEDEDQSAYEALQHLPPDERRKALRRLRNRESARRVRARRLAEMSSMEATLKGLQKENVALKEHVNKLQIHTQTVTMKVYEVTAKYEAAVAENAQLREELQRAKRASLTGDSSFTVPLSAALAAPTALHASSASAPVASSFLAPCAADEGSALATTHGLLQLRSSSPLELQNQRQAVEEVVMLLQEHRRRRQQALQDGSGGSDNASSAAHQGMNTAASATNTHAYSSGSELLRPQLGSALPVALTTPSYCVETGSDNGLPSGPSGYSPMAPGPAALYPSTTCPSGLVVATGPGVLQTDDVNAQAHQLHHLQGQMQPQQSLQQQPLAHTLSTGTGTVSGSCTRRMSCHDAASPPCPQPLPLPSPALPPLPPAVAQLLPQQSLLTASRGVAAPKASALAGSGGSLELPSSSFQPPQSFLMQSQSHPVPMPQAWQPFSAAHLSYGFATYQHAQCQQLQQQQQGINTIATGPYWTASALSTPAPFFTAATPDGMASQGLCPAPEQPPSVQTPCVGPDCAGLPQAHNGMVSSMAPGWAGWAGLGILGTNSNGGGGGGLEIPDDVYMALDDYMPQDL